jgi:hypothetical protein
LYKYADIYPKDRKKFDEMKNFNIWEHFQSDNVYSLDGYQNFKKSNKRSESMLNVGVVQGIKSFESSRKIKSNILSENFSDITIRGIFFNFFLSLFEAYDEKRHYEITDEAVQDISFDKSKFVEDSSADIKLFLEFIKDQSSFDNFIQNVNHIVDQRHKEDIKKTHPKYSHIEIKMNQGLKENSLIPDFHPIYQMFMSGLERVKKNKPVEKLFKIKIYNTITISSPPYEVLEYKQNNIFIDPIHDLMIKHEASLPLYKENIHFSMVNLKDQIEFNKNLLKEEQNYLKNKDTAIDLKYANMNKKVEESKNIKDICAVITKELNNMNKLNPPMIEFKNFLFTYGDVVKKFFGLLPTKIKKYLKEIDRGNSNLGWVDQGSGLGQGEDNLNQMKISAGDGFLRGSESKKAFRGGKSIYVRSKDDFIKSFDHFLRGVEYRGDFHLNFAVNLIQSVSFCDYCSKPNNIWDIRKEFIYSKLRKETKTKCKFCSQYFTPYFFVLEEGQEDEKTYKKRGMNRSFEEKHFDSSIENDFKKDLISNKNTLDNTKVLRRIEYMCIEHIMAIYYDHENEEKANRLKKFPYALFYNVCLLMGEIKVIIDKNTTYDTLDTFVMKKIKGGNIYGSINYDGNNLNLNLSPITSHNSPNILKILEENKNKRLSEVKKSNEKKIADKKTKKINPHQKIPSIIKFNLKDLMSGKQYEEFQRDLNGLPKFHQVDVNHYEEFLKNSKKTRRGGISKTNLLKESHRSKHTTTIRSSSKSARHKFEIIFADKTKLQTPKSKSKSRSHSHNKTKNKSNKTKKNLNTYFDFSKSETQFMFSQSNETEDLILDRVDNGNFQLRNQNYPSHEYHNSKKRNPINGMEKNNVNKNNVNKNKNKNNVNPIQNVKNHVSLFRKTLEDLYSATFSPSTINSKKGDKINVNNRKNFRHTNN